MDPLTAVSLAGTIVQFVSFSREIVHIGKETYMSASGARTETVEVETMIASLSTIHDSLRCVWSNDRVAHERSNQEQMLIKLVEQCEPIYKELQTILQKLHVQGNHRKWKSFCTALKYAWKEDEINDLEKRLIRLQGQIDSHLISDVRMKQASTVRMVRELLENSRRLEINRGNDLQLIDRKIRDAFDSLQSTKNPPQPVDEQNTTLQDTLRQWIWGVQMAGFERPADTLLSDLATQARQAKVYVAERYIIRELTFDGMKNRQNEIKPAHLETFQWIFSPSPNRPSPQHFATWLKEGDGIFWISGKPGSGKSTLMKYIFNDPRTKDMLSRWSGASALTTASFYFWSSGTMMQKSIKGLLQSLLCQILRQCPSLISDAFPRQWKNITDAQIGEESDIAIEQQDLIDAIKGLDVASTADKLNTRFCFFIDGLDEYDGFDRDIAALIKTLSSSNSIKICLASRPHNVFVSNFGGEQSRMLNVHEFTDWDIRQYIKDVLQGTAAFVSRKNQDPTGYQKLAEYIRTESNGVFLWVYLVVMRLLDGMENADRMSDLQQKLEKIPTDLRALFAHILSSVEEDYHEQQAQMLFVACQANRPLALLAYSFLDDSGFSISGAAMDENDIKRRCTDMKMRVVARCKLLLEVVDVPGEHPYFGSYVSFLHRTVRDYLRESDAQQLLASRLKGPFKPRQQICNALLAQIKFLPSCSETLNKSWWERGGHVHTIVHDCLQQARDSEVAGEFTIGPVLTYLELVVNESLGKLFFWWSREGLPNKGEAEFAFLDLIIHYQLPRYLKCRLNGSASNPSLSQLQISTLLGFALRCPKAQFHSPAPPRALNADIVKILLDHGANPNMQYISQSTTGSTPWSTPWRLFMLSLYEGSHALDPDENAEQQRFHTLEHLILGGADLSFIYYPGINGPQRESGERGNGLFIESGITVDQMIQKSMSAANAQFLLKLIEQQRRQNSGVLGWLGWK